MALYHFKKIVRDSEGDAVASVEVTVKEAGTETNATIYSDSAGTGKANPFTSDADGRYDFWIDEGAEVDLDFSKTGFTISSENGITIPWITTSAPSTRAISTTSPITGGGDLSSNRTFGFDAFEDIRAHGALVDGSTNDAVAVQAAQDAAAASGGVVFFPPGTTLISSTILYDDNVSFVGAGRQASRIRISGDITGIKARDQGSAGTFRVSFRNLTVDQASSSTPRTGRYGIDVRDTSFVLLENVAIWAQERGLLHGHGGAGGVGGGYYLTAVSCEFNNNDYGTWADDNGNAAWFMGCRYWGNDVTGAYAEDCVGIRWASAFESEVIGIDLAGATHGCSTRDSYFETFTTAPIRAGASTYLNDILRGNRDFYLSAHAITDSGLNGDYRAYVHRAANQTIANNTITAIEWDTETLDVRGLHSTATNPSRITIPASGGRGTWHISASVEFDTNGTGRRDVYLYLNGSRTKVFRNSSASSTLGEQMWFGTIAELVAGDYVEIRVVQNSGGNLDVLGDSEQTWFSVARIA